MQLHDNTIKTQNRAILVTLALSEYSNKEYIEDIDAAVLELKNLAEAAEVEVLGSVVQNKDTVDAAYFIGSGKVDEIRDFVQKMEANLVIFNHELSGSQIRNIEDAVEVDVIDRTTLILEIFARRAQTKEGKLQVELAQLKYRLPRLRGLGNKLSRTGAGIGTRGPGEKKLETDRRHIESRIHEIEKDLKESEKNRGIQRSKRLKSGLPIVALVGYTNAGKSTLMNQMIQLNPDHDENKEVFEKDMLFATLDTSLRRATLPNGNDFLLTDTVGFVSRLPHALVRAFRSTLEEVLFADLLLIVSDLSDEHYRMQKETTLTVLKELGASIDSILYVNNKLDKLDHPDKIRQNDDSIYISAKNRENVQALLDKISVLLRDRFQTVTLFFSYAQAHLVNEIHNVYSVVESVYEEDGIRLNVTLTREDAKRYRMYVLN